MRVRVVRDREDGLVSQSWDFWLDADRCQIRLSGCLVSQRKSLRAKFVPVKGNDGCNTSKYLRVEWSAVPVPDDVLAEARDLLTAMVQQAPYVARS